MFTEKKEFWQKGDILIECYFSKNENEFFIRDERVKTRTLIGPKNLNCKFVEHLARGAV